MMFLFCVVQNILFPNDFFLLRTQKKNSRSYSAFFVPPDLLYTQ